MIESTLEWDEMESLSFFHLTFSLCLCVDWFWFDPVQLGVLCARGVAERMDS